jgi:Mor family transcriptional regulator
MALDRIKKIDDVEERGKTAVEAMENAERYVAGARAIRDEAIYQLSKTGRKPYDLAQKFSLSKSAVVSIIRLGRAKEEARA